MGWMPKYSNIACFTHSFTTHPPAASGDATLSLPLSTSSITALTASEYFVSFNKSLLPQTSAINCLNSISEFLANILQNRLFKTYLPVSKYFCPGMDNYTKNDSAGSGDIERNLEKDLEGAVATLRAGGIILYPTDTIWG